MKDCRPPREQVRAWSKSGEAPGGPLDARKFCVLFVTQAFTPALAMGYERWADRDENNRLNGARRVGSTHTTSNCPADFAGPSLLYAWGMCYNNVSLERVFYRSVFMKRYGEHRFPASYLWWKESTLGKIHAARPSPPVAARGGLRSGLQRVELFAAGSRNHQTGQEEAGATPPPSP